MSITITAEFVHLLVRFGIAALCFVALAGMMYACWYMGKHNLIEQWQKPVDRKQTKE